MTDRPNLPEIAPATDEAVNRAASLLRAGRLVAFPTETVYGLGADATDDRAVASIFEAKGRPRFNPLIVHVVDRTAAQAVATFDERARLLADIFWPGPLTLVLPRAPGAAVSLLVSAGLDSVAVRVPGHPVARALLAACGRPVAAPSANRSGGVSPTTPLHVSDSLGHRVDMILAGGRCRIGLESTVVDLTGPRALLLRHGGVTREEVEELIGPVEVETAPSQAPKSPGQLTSHYAPGLPVRLHATEARPDEALIGFGRNLMFVKGGAVRLNLSEQGDLQEAAANLFAMLRSVDRPGDFSGIAVTGIPDRGLGVAINDRLTRAAAPRPAPLTAQDPDAEKT